MDPSEKQNPSFQAVTLPLMRAFCWGLMTLLGPLKRLGAYRVPKSGGVLVLSNHQADIDPIVVQLACKRPVYFMAKSELFEMKGVRYFLKLFRAFSVKRGEPDRNSIKHAVNLLKDGEVVCIYPEGELSETGELLPLKPGIALIIRMAQVPVICLGIDGSRRVMPYGSMIPRPAFHTIKATWGEAHEFPKDANTEDILAWADAELRSCLML
ncbi:MAG TPA: lysophospholipid acyltransferase family protein [Fimbriimonadaceae bacterium]|jgi:1-acyl-sn-glycerol-3-phosphate acyltransferase